MLSDTFKLECTIMNLPWSMAKGPGHRITYKWCFVGRDDWRMYIVIMHQQLPRCQISCTLQRGLLTLFTNMHLSAAYDSIWYLGKRITLSSSVTKIFVLASLTPSTPGFNLTSLVAINLFMLAGIHLHLLCPPLVFPRDQSWDLCSFYYIPTFRYRPSIQCSAPSVRWRHQHHANLYISFLHRLFSWHIKSHSLIHSFTVSPLMILF